MCWSKIQMSKKSKLKKYLTKKMIIFQPIITISKPITRLLTAELSSGWLSQGPLYKGTEHSLKISFLKLQVGGGLQLHPWGWMGVDDLNHNITECTEFFARLWKMKNLIMSSASTCFTFFQNKNIGSKQSYRGFWIPPTL